MLVTTETIGQEVIGFFPVWLMAVWSEPANIWQCRCRATVTLSFKEFSTTENGVLATELKGFLGEHKDFLVGFLAGPVKPRKLVVLTIGIVVASLASADFVS